MKRLIRKANHDIGRRDKALLYIDGKVYAALNALITSLGEQFSHAYVST